MIAAWNIVGGFVFAASLLTLVASLIHHDYRWIWFPIFLLCVSGLAVYFDWRNKDKSILQSESADETCTPFRAGVRKMEPLKKTIEKRGMKVLNQSIRDNASYSITVYRPNKIDVARDRMVSVNCRVEDLANKDVDDLAAGIERLLNLVAK